MGTLRTRLTAVAAALATIEWCTVCGAALPGAVENPQPESYQSGIGLISGWSCTPGTVTAVIDGSSAPVVLPYGSARADTASACGAGNINTGFGLLLNYNTLGAGAHSAQVMVDGVPLATTQFIVNVPAGEFIGGISRDVTVANFPVTGKNTTLTWQQAQQNFAIKSVVAKSADLGSSSTTSSPATTASVEAATFAGDAAAAGAALENPQPGSYQSGIGLLSGWSCSGPDISMVIDGSLTLKLPYGSVRADTANVCGTGNTGTGFGLLVNYNTLGAGTHTARLVVNGVAAGDTQFTVTVPAGEFLAGAHKDIAVEDFPAVGQRAILTWQESQQNFALKHTGPTVGVDMFYGSGGNDYWMVTSNAVFTIDGLNGVDTLALGIMRQCYFKLSKAASGAVQVDIISSASHKEGSFRALLVDVEQLAFDSGTYILDLRTYDFSNAPCANK